MWLPSLFINVIPDSPDRRASTTLCTSVRQCCHTCHSQASVPGRHALRVLSISAAPTNIFATAGVCVSVKEAPTASALAPLTTMLCSVMGTDVYSYLSYPAGGIGQTGQPSTRTLAHLERRTLHPESNGAPNLKLTRTVHFRTLAVISRWYLYLQERRGQSSASGRLLLPRAGSTRVA